MLIGSSNGRTRSRRFPPGIFVKQDEGRPEPGSGRPTLNRSVAAIGGHDTLVFRRQELVNHDEDAFDHLVTGSGYTWIAVISVYEQVVQLKDVNSFFGNLKNGGMYEGIWGNVTDDNRVWKMVVGQERDAINHPGRESFDGELARFLVYERPLTDDELRQTMESLKTTYAIQ